MRSTESLVEKEEPEFKVDLRIGGIAQDVILKDEERMDQIPKVFDKLRKTHAKSIIEDVGKTRKSIRFSGESSREIHEQGNIELHELGHISRTVQCPEGLVFFACSICLRHDEEQLQRIKPRPEVMIVPYYHARVTYSRGKRHGEA